MLTHSFHFFIIVLYCFVCTVVVKGRAPKAPALYVFGDSLVDNGNNNDLLTLAKANYYPYGIDFPEGHTGRSTNGKNLADLVSDYLGLPFSLRFMGSSTKDIWLTGYNYASSSSGILPESGSIVGKCLNLDKQIRYFESTIEHRLKKHYIRTNLSEHLSKSIVLMVTGVNDYANNYLAVGYLNKYKNMTPETFSEVLCKRLARKLEKLHSLGVRKLIYLEVVPVGCMPSSIRQGRCDAKMNRIIALFNEKARRLFSNLKSTFPDSKFVFSEAYRLTRDVVNYPTQYGFEDTRESCCEATVLEVQCIPGLRPCKNRNKYCFWDGFHPTQALYSVLFSRSVSENLDSMLQ